MKTTPSDNNKAYWMANISLLSKLLVVWFVVSFGCGIILVDWLDQFSLFGFKLGFWFAQQGAIYVFVALIFIYTWRMKVIDRQFGVSDDENETWAPKCWHIFLLGYPLPFILVSPSGHVPALPKIFTLPAAVLTPWSMVWLPQLTGWAPHHLSLWQELFLLLAEMALSISLVGPVVMSYWPCY